MMKRRLAAWMLRTSLKMEPLFAVGIQQAADERACARLREAIQEAARDDVHEHQLNVSRIAKNN